jgi:hypothetical protein
MRSLKQIDVFLASCVLTPQLRHPNKNQERYDKTLKEAGNTKGSSFSQFLDNTLVFAKWALTCSPPRNVVSMIYYLCKRLPVVVCRSDVSIFLISNPHFRMNNS